MTTSHDALFIGGEWVPLVTLVRLPKLSGVYCTADPDVGCSLPGADLFLLDSVSVDADFTRATRVPDGYTAAALRIKRSYRAAGLARATSPSWAGSVKTTWWYSTGSRCAASRSSQTARRPAWQRGQ